MSQTLTLIAEEVRSCTNCRLHQGTRNGVPGEGNQHAEILFVGEGPGFHEDAQGRPFVGPAGQLLNEMLERAGLKREDVYITNVVKHRPPGNRDPLPDELEACGEYLQRQIEAIKTALNVTLGRFSMATFFGPQARITQVHWTIRPWRDMLAYACFHPAAALRQPKYREGLEQDFDGLPKALDVARKRAADRTSSRPDDAVSAAAGDEAEAPSQMTMF